MAAPPLVAMHGAEAVMAVPASPSISKTGLHNSSISSIVPRMLSQILVGSAPLVLLVSVSCLTRAVAMYHLPAYKKIHAWLLGGITYLTSALEHPHLPCSILLTH
jgi:hypothetical protein